MTLHDFSLPLLCTKWLKLRQPSLYFVATEESRGLNGGGGMAPYSLPLALQKTQLQWYNPNKGLSPFVAREDALWRMVFLRWLQHLTGSGVALLLDRTPLLRVAVKHLTLLTFLTFRIAQYVPNSHLFGLGLWQRGPEAVFLAGRTQDPMLLMAWVQTRIARMSMFTHRRFFRLLGLLLISLTYGPAPLIQGVNMYLVGKISVTGNAMSRSQYAKTGVGGPNNLRTQVAQAFTLVRTHTGCLGLTLSLYYK